MDGLERLLRILEDGREHLIDELASRLGWTVSRMRRLVLFLSERGLVRYQREDDIVMLDDDLLALLRET